jgi:hypothetical protein
MLTLEPTAEYPVDITGHILADVGVGSSLWDMMKPQVVLSLGLRPLRDRLGGQRCFRRGMMRSKVYGTIQFAFDGAAQDCPDPGSHAGQVVRGFLTNIERCCPEGLVII